MYCKFWIYEWENTHSLNSSPNSVAVQKCRYLADNLLSFSFILNLNAFFMMSPGDVPLSPFASFPFEVLYIWISRFTAPPRHVHRQLPISIYNLFLSTFSTKHNKTEGGEPRCWRGANTATNIVHELLLISIPQCYRQTIPSIRSGRGHGVNRRRNALGRKYCSAMTQK